MTRARMRPLVLAVLLLAGCAGEPRAAKPSLVTTITRDASFSVPGETWLIRVRRCDYVVVTTANGVVALHAADCENPAHAAGLKPEAP